MITIDKIDHIGIRVTDRNRALSFYQILGFELELEVDFDAVVIIKNTQGVELNLIVNGVSQDNKNILMDMPIKYTGITHVALRVADINQVLQTLKQHHIKITQGPVTFGDGHVSVFIRDPDKNTIELRARLNSVDAKQIEGLVFYDPKV